MDTRQFAGRSALVGGIGVLCVVVVSAGVATAAHGGPIMLGQSNAATHTTTLKDPKGTALSLISKRSSPPLKVNSKALVKNFNASELGGLTASKLSTGSGAQIKLNVFSSKAQGIVLPQPTGTAPAETFFPESIVSTAKLAAGTYEVNASTLAAEVFCWIGTSPAMGSQQYGITSTTPSTIALPEILTVTKNQRIALYCAGANQSAGQPGGSIIDGGITAVKLVSSAPGTTHHTNAPVIFLRKGSSAR